MKKLKKMIFAAMLFVSTAPFAANAISTSVATQIIRFEPKPLAKTDNNALLILRLNEIKSMDLSKLNAGEKRKLHREVKGIEKELMNNGNGGGVYISVGAIIIILLVLLLIF